MSRIHRYYAPGATIFITQVVYRRIPVFEQPHFVDLLRQNLHATMRLHPFSMTAYCFLPDHFHIMMHPTGTSNFSAIMHSLKPNFTKDYKAMLGITGKMKFWQKGFWDHVIRDEEDFRRHLDYIHYNPVKHGFVLRPEEWPYSSYAIWQARGVYPEKWGGASAIHSRLQLARVRGGSGLTFRENIAVWGRCGCEPHGLGRGMKAV